MLIPHVSFRRMPSSAKPPHRGTNSPSMSATVTLNTAFQYRETTSLMHFSSVTSFQSATTSIAPNFMFRDSVTNEGTLLTYMRSTHRVISPLCSNMEVVSTDMAESTIGGPRRVVLPFRVPISGRNNLLAIITSRGITGQFGRLLAFRILIRSLSDGRPTMTCSSWALTARR